MEYVLWFEDGEIAIISAKDIFEALEVCKKLVRDPDENGLKIGIVTHSIIQR
jgi:hypothetical protein